MKTASFMKNEVLLRYVFTFLLLKRLKSFVCFSFPSFWGPLKSWRQLSSGKKEVNNETGSTTVESHNPAPGTTLWCTACVPSCTISHSREEEWNGVGALKKVHPSVRNAWRIAESCKFMRKSSKAKRIFSLLLLLEQLLFHFFFFRVWRRFCLHIR